MSIQDAAEVVRAWHAALNDGDLEQLVALSTPDVEVGGPRGTGRGADVLRAWFARAGVQIEPRQIFGRDQAMVVAQSATWSAPAAGSAPGAASTGADIAAGAPQDVASVFVVRDGLVARVVRYADVESALEAAGLTLADRVEP